MILRQGLERAAVVLLERQRAQDEAEQKESQQKLETSIERSMVCVQQEL